MASGLQPSSASPELPTQASADLGLAPQASPDLGLIAEPLPYPTDSFPYDPGPTLSIAGVDADKLEGDAGRTAFTFTVVRTGDVTDAGSVDWSVVGMMPQALYLAIYGEADAEDFGLTRPGGTLFFDPGETTKTLSVGVLGDSVPEVPEIFSVVLSNPINGTLDPGEYWDDAIIENDDVYYLFDTPPSDVIV